MLRERRERLKQSNPIFVALAQADDPARADRDAGVTHGGERVEPVLVDARGRDLAVVFGARVEVVVVGGQAGRAEVASLGVFFVVVESFSR